MVQFLKRAAGKISRDFSNMKQMGRLLAHSARLPEAEDALSFLQHCSPDLGRSCWKDCEFDYEKRSVLLSVIVPAYNVEKYIVNCLESILQQSVSFDYEVIVVNDGSTDTTGAICENYKHRKGFRIIHQENRGLSAARNTGIACSKGEYLCFVDSDDELPEDSLECLMTLALQQHAKLVVGSYEKCLRNGTVLHTKLLRNEQVTENTLPGFAWGKVFHYSVFMNLRFPEGYWFEDSIMAQIVHPLCKDSTYSTSHICYKYYSNETGITVSSKGNMKSIDSLWITMRLLQERQKFQLSSTKASYEYFLSMVNLTYSRTKQLDVRVAQCVFVIQKMLIDTYYDTYKSESSRKKTQIEEALRTNNFRKYVLACESK